VRGSLLVVECPVFPCIVGGHVVYSSQKVAGGDEEYGMAPSQSSSVSGVSNLGFASSKHCALSQLATDFVRM
jgi:hypothetical protein